ncbi:putative HTH-type transcriptional regulator ydeS [Beauveria bassiana D1-5]|uniref:Putative HTH-type transcriptional regulator ydeS n=1 Tax=Beauveria bassiana D1-5 TaxID=1245745 RepID=A0A0A2WIS9_BEABA|nr:hypothetical protein VW41_23315 [Klebsiella michiganensis]KGQ13044.1 putative HTH-type transcriptional regulator ydeS [Beauveria bassiana D1-5]
MHNEVTASPGRKRSEASRQAILEATWEQLNALGFQGMSIEGVAARAGVGKATIYRWWASKGVLAVEAFLTAISPTLAFPETASARRDIERQIDSLVHVYRGRAGALFGEMIGASQADAEMRTAFYIGYLKPRREAAKAAFQRGIELGQFRSGLDLEALVDALYGPIIYRMLTGIFPLDAAFVEHTRRVVFDGITP